MDDNNLSQNEPKSKTWKKKNKKKKTRQKERGNSLELSNNAYYRHEAHVAQDDCPEI